MPSPEHRVAPVLVELAAVAPTRLTGTPGERATHDAIATRLAKAGYTIARRPFRFPRHIYGSLALHFGLALLLAASPLAGVPTWAAAIGHLVVALSFYSEAVWRRHLLRRLWPRIATENVLATRPSVGPARRRVVLVAHVDSAFTGLMFHPALVRLIAAPPPRPLGFLRKQLALPFASLFVLAALELAGVGPAWWTLALCVPAFLVFALNGEIVLRNRPVPGAADNLTGCAALVALAEAWAERELPDDVELVFAFTGAEEAGTGGATELARTMGWDRETTQVLALDTLSNGTLFALEEGELFRVPMPEALFDAAQAAARDAGLDAPERYTIPAGATDALPFLVEGYPALALTCIDPEQHAPRNYHHPNDTVANVDPVQLRDSTRIADRLVARLLGAEACFEARQIPSSPAPAVESADGPSRVSAA